MKIIRIKDYYGKYQEVPVDDALYDEWIKLENENQRIYRKEVYHRSGVPLEQADSVYRSLQAAFRKLRDLMAEYEDEVRRGIVE